MSHNQVFQILLSGDKQTILTNVKVRIAEADGDFQGDTDAGHFSATTPFGLVQGEYSVDQRNIATIQITQKPFLLSIEEIKTTVEEYFAEPESTYYV